MEKIKAVERFFKSDVLLYRTWIVFSMNLCHEKKTFPFSLASLNKKDMPWKQDNAQPLKLLCNKRGILRHAIYLLSDLKICDRVLIRELKQQLKRQSFTTHTQAKHAIKSVLLNILEQKFYHQMDKFYEYCQDAKDTEGVYCMCQICTKHFSLFAADVKTAWK